MSEVIRLCYRPPAAHRVLLPQLVTSSQVYPGHPRDRKQSAALLRGEDTDGPEGQRQASET